ncbi:MAG: carbohydrate porin, partial [Proteobacteria bacterium]|nr:carbohydrate porin [Pseudomonadota bacterium]
VITAFLTPGANEHVTAITNFQFNLQIAEGWTATIGRINTIDLWAVLYPKYGKGLDGFMNTSMMVPLNTVPTLPLIFNAAGVLKAGERGVEAALLVLDPVFIPTTSNLDNLFDNGSTIVGIGRIFTDFGGLPGSHMILGTYATGKYTSFDRNGFSFQPGQGLVAPQKTGSWMAAYILQQTLWRDPCDQRRSIDLTSTWGFSDPETSPYEWTANVSLEAYGLIRGREDDRMGAGYFYDGLSGQFKQLVSALPGLDLQDVHGVELYYNAAIRPWFHLTADLQVVDNQNVADDPAVILGLRAKIDL